MMQFKNQDCIDKTQDLEKGIELFPSIYVEGAAAVGKTVAVEMLLDKHPEVKNLVFKMNKYQESTIFREQLEAIKVQMETESIWVVFENMQMVISREIIVEMVEFVENLPQKCRVIFVGRERPQEELLSLLWKRNMKLVSAESLLFTEMEIQKLVDKQGSYLNAAEIFAETGGWPGCVNLMIQFSENQSEKYNAKELHNCYEIATYIQKEILDILSQEEQEMMCRAEVCPWLNASLCREVWGMHNVEINLEMLTRKGMLVHNKEKKRWKTASLFRKNDKIIKQSQSLWEQLGNWYEANGFVSEALSCLEQLDDQTKYQKCMLTNYRKIPLLECSYEKVMSWKDSSLETSYLRGMYCYSQRNFEGLKQEIKKLDPMKGGQEKEIFLNLSYMNPEITLDEWLKLLEKYTEGTSGIRLYNILGNAHTFLCGLRDLSGLFSCGKKEEKQKAKIWKSCLGEEEWIAYQFAKIDYYLETEREAQLSAEEKELLEEYEEPWQFRLAKMYLCIKLQNQNPSAENKERANQLKTSLMQEDNSVCLRNTIALSCLYLRKKQEANKMASWLRYTEMEIKEEVSEKNYIMLFCQAKGYLFLNQYEKAERIFRRVIPYLQTYRRFRFLGELLFQQAIVNWKKKNHSQALKNIIEAFVVNGSQRYVAFYKGYGISGIEVMNEYVEWLRTHSAEGWHRKKKYNYGNVLKMPLEDYMEVILQNMKAEERKSPVLTEEVIEENLTMMEMIVLHNIGRGLKNAEICEELGLKITTVKSHIYSLYKKLGVNSRSQAILKGKELGILE